MKIKLTTEGCFTKVDDDDFKRYSNRKWYKSHYGYAVGYQYLKKKRGICYLHRLILKAKKNQEIDHINGDRLDNRKCNLRVCNKSQNQANRHKIRDDNKSGCTGVYFSKPRNKWIAKIKVNYKSIYLGGFEEYNEAVKVRNAASKHYFGKFARRD